MNGSFVYVNVPFNFDQLFYYIKTQVHKLIKGMSMLEQDKITTYGFTMRCVYDAKMKIKS